MGWDTREAASAEAGKFGRVHVGRMLLRPYTGTRQTWLASLTPPGAWLSLPHDGLVLIL